MKKAPFTTKSQGFSLVEVLLSIATFSLLVTTLVGAYLYGQESVLLSGHRVRATLLAEEGLEVAKNIRDESWDNLIDGTHGLQISGNQWEFSGSQDQTNIFNRQVEISSIDTKRKLITSTVTWPQNNQRNGSITMQTLLSYWQEVIATSIGDWSLPQFESGQEIIDTGFGEKIRVQGDYAYLVLSNGALDFRIFDISDTANPQAVGSLSLPGNLTNIAVEGDYALVTSNSNSEELVVIDISNPNSPSEIDSYNLPGNQNARGVEMVGNYAYVVQDDSNQDEFFIFDLSTPSNINLLGSIDLNDDGNEIVVIGNYAYVATDGHELEVVDISNTNSPQSVKTLNLSGGSNANTITGAGNNVYIGRGNGGIDSIDISDPLNPVALSNIDNGSAVRDLDLGNNNTYLFAATDQNDAEFQLIDVTDPSNIQLLSLYDGSADFNGVAYHEDKDRACLVSENLLEALTILMPQ